MLTGNYSNDKIKLSFETNSWSRFSRYCVPDTEKMDKTATTEGSSCSVSVFTRALRTLLSQTAPERRKGDVNEQNQTVPQHTA